VAIVVLRTQSVTTTHNKLCSETNILMVQHLTVTQGRIHRFGIERCAPSELSALNHNPLPVTWMATFVAMTILF
jgi:hypothetical protein